MTLYNIIYIINNVFMAYVIYRFLRIFYAQKRTTKVIEGCCYAGYAVLISLTAFFDTPPLVYILLSLGCTFALTFLYQGKVKKQMLSTVLIYITMIVIEDIITFLSGYYTIQLLTPLKYNSSIGITVISICTFAIVLLLENLKDLKKGKEIPVSYWLAIIFVPVSTIYLLLFTSSLFDPNRVGTAWLMVLNNIIILLINILVFYMYNKIAKLVAIEGEKDLITQQNKYFHEQLSLMQDSQEATKSIRHDMRNHLASIKARIETGEYQKAEKYITDTIGQLEKKEEISHTGHFLLDSIINYKLRNIKKCGAQLRYHAVIPNDLPIEDFDLTIILGNLLDNALEALKRINAAEKLLEIHLVYEKGCFLIKVQNTYNGDLLIEKGLPVTQKTKAHYHGIGLKNVRAIAAKYRGSLDITHESGTFTVVVLLYL